jgi:hypothetical protein
LTKKATIFEIFAVTKSSKVTRRLFPKQAGVGTYRPRPQGQRPRVAFSGSLWTEAAPSGVVSAVSAFSKRARIYRGVEQPGSSSGS